jgi:pimeloyl-ACP methyl ester carboxylesterase
MKLMKAALRRLWRLRRATSIVAGLAVVVALVAGVVSLAVAAPSSGDAMAASIESSAQRPGCDEVPTGVATQDYWLRFNVPPGLMPDKQFDGLPAKLQVHRVRPVYANGKCPSVPTQAVVLIHGRTVPGPVLFDLRDPATGGGDLSVQERLARAGIDTFAPSLLGYGRSTRFDEGLNDPGNASLRAYEAPGGTGCAYPEGCDRTLIPGINPLNQQGDMLLVNPLAGQRRAHSSKSRFARTDVWVRDIDQVIADAIERARPTDGKVALVGYSLGGQHVGRTLYVDNPNELLEDRDKVIGKVSRVVFLNSLFGGPTEEPDPYGLPTFPLTVNDQLSPVIGSDALWNLPQGAVDCEGRIIPGTKDQVWAQTMEHETVGREWGGPQAGNPKGLNRAPTFSGYGWNRAVAGQLSTPTLVMQGLLDGVLPTGPKTGKAIYDALPAYMTNKVLVQVECASHALPWEGCVGDRCKPTSGTPYGGRPGAPWAGPHATLKAALIEWIKSGTFNGAANGSFIVNGRGVARPAP